MHVKWNPWMVLMNTMLRIVTKSRLIQLLHAENAWISALQHEGRIESFPVIFPHRMGGCPFSWDQLTTYTHSYTTHCSSNGLIVSQRPTPLRTWPVSWKEIVHCNDVCRKVLHVVERSLTWIPGSAELPWVLHSTSQTTTGDGANKINVYEC